MKAVTSIEHDKVWYNKCLHEIHSENTRLLHVSLNLNGAYTKAATITGEKYNILLVNGRKRVQCIFDNYENFTDDGVIILDDLEREDIRTQLNS